MGSGRIHSLESFGTLDGPGIRFVVFFQGCALRCRYCHNPDTWDPAGGRETTVSELLRKIESCRNFLRSGGVTLSGGEPLLQPEFARELLTACRESGFHTALDTAGSVPLSVSAPVLNAADLVLLDIKALDPGLCTALTGHDNRNELATLDFCESAGKTVWIRHVLVPGYTMEEAHLQALANYLRRYTGIRRIDLLPFHRMGSYKWSALGMSDSLADVPEPTREQCAEAARYFPASLVQGV